MFNEIQNEDVYFTGNIRLRCYYNILGKLKRDKHIKRPFH